MFEKKQLIYSSTQGVCRVENIVQLSTSRSKDNSITYYVLRPLFDKEQTAYIPVEHHQVELRELFSREEAAAMMADPRTKEDEHLLQAVEYILGEEGAGKDGTTAAAKSS